jgi:hypothetical protein
MLAPRLHRFNNLKYLNGMADIKKEGTKVLKYQNPGFRLWFVPGIKNVVEEIYDEADKKWLILRTYEAKEHKTPAKAAKRA